MLPKLTVNRRFMSELIAEDTPCLALGLVEVEGKQCALVALRFEEAIPRDVAAAGFRFGHSLLGTSSWEVVHFGFEFYGFATYMYRRAMMYGSTRNQGCFRRTLGFLATLDDQAWVIPI